MVADEGSQAFIREVAKYYRDFLETDFKRQRAPARQVRLRAASGAALGFNVRRFPTLLADLSVLLAKPYEGDTKLEVRRGRYLARVTPRVQQLVRTQIEALPPDAYRTAINEALIKISKASRAKAKAKEKAEDFDALVDVVQLIIAQEVTKSVVRPVSKRVEASLEGNLVDAEELLYEIEDDIEAHVISTVRENLPKALAELVVNSDLIPLTQLLNDQLGQGPLSEFLADFFANLATADAYDDLLAVMHTLKTNENLECYLYLLDVTLAGEGGGQFPLAYIPMKLSKLGECFVLELDSRLFFNRRALRYISEVDTTGRRKVPGRPTDERIHFLFDCSARALLEDASVAVGDAYYLDKPLVLTSTSPQVATGIGVKLTNAMHICAYDKSEESIVNDYEQILMEAQQPGGGALKALFDDIVASCILENPVTVDGPVHEEWSKTPPPERLVYDSPVPLNEEQRKLLIALGRKDCRFLAIEGPPGTGKSHTITALVFDAILKGKSVLVLSDKQEALDVVEDKLTETLNAVRGDPQFQNPILRLGRDSSTYARILQKSSLSRITTHYQAAAPQAPKRKDETRKRAETLRAQVKATIEAVSKIKLPEVVEFETLESEFEVASALPVEVCSAAAERLRVLHSALQGLSDTQKSEFRDLVQAMPDGLSLAAAAVRLRAHLAQAEWSATYAQAIPHLGNFKSIDAERVVWLANEVRELEALRMPILGYLFRGAQVKEVAERFRATLPLEGVRAPHQRVASLTVAAAGLTALQAIARRHDLPDSFIAEAFTELRRGAVTTSLPVLFAASLADSGRFLSDRPEIAQSLGLTNEPAKSLARWEPETLSRLGRLARYLELRGRLSVQFAAVPELDLQKSQRALQQLHSEELAHVLDERLVEFTQKNQATANALKDVIRNKRQFPKASFELLTEAFPCIIAGIRDFADYIPLEPGIVDVVVIDEASQVSIAQAFPAILRAKQVVVLGDEKQFANVKTSQASHVVNSEYVNALQQVFVDHFGHDEQLLARMRQFDVRTSILKFFDLISNFRVMLKKHFRGYQELISFSSQYFYNHELQAIRIRAKRIDEVLKFSVLPAAESGGLEPRNCNTREAAEIERVLNGYLEYDTPPSVGVITPFTEQQRYLTRQLLFMAPHGEDYRTRLKLKVMTFDTCQGEERDIVLYSMVAADVKNKLNYVFPVSLDGFSEDVDARLKVQRLNVGFSRCKETMHFVLSMPVEQFGGSIGQVLRHYQRELEVASTLPESSQVDHSSPMEAKLLNWLTQTNFVQDNLDDLEIIPQFEIGRVLRQLDPKYQHPAYRVDFLLLYRPPGERTLPIVIEYDGFKEHFTNRERVNEANYEWYYREEDVERQFVLESYGYNFLRVNRFNLGTDPVTKLSSRLYEIVEQRQAPVERSASSKATQELIAKLEAKEAKMCPKCEQVKDLKHFYRRNLARKYGRICNSCFSSA